MKLKFIAAALLVGCYTSATVTASQQLSEPHKLQQPNLTSEQIARIQAGQSLLAQPTASGQLNQHIRPNREKISFADQQEQVENLYFVRLQDKPVSLYRGGIKGLQATSLAAQNHNARSAQKANKLFFAGQAKSSAIASYQRYLQQRQDNLIDDLQQLIGQRQISKQFTLAVNGFTLSMTGKEAKKIAALPQVAYVHQAQNYQLFSDQSSKQIGAAQVHAGQAADTPYQGEGIIIGVIDTGVNSDHPSFADVGADGYDHTNPFGSGVYVGDCAQAEFAGRCNDKLIGIRSYAEITDVYDQVIPGWPAIGEDYDGHGSHTASTAAGNVLYNVDYRLPVTGDNASDGNLVGKQVFSEVSGVAPHANIISYQVCHAKNEAGYKGCPFEAMVSGIEDAIRDGVDVINFSIGGQEKLPWTDGVELAFLAAREAGISVAVAAGNSGRACANECFSAIDHASPWLLNVAATTHDRVIQINTPVSYAGYAMDAAGNPLGSSLPLWHNSGKQAGSKNTQAITGVVVQARDYADTPDVPSSDGYCGNPYSPGTFDFYPDGTPIVGAAEGQTKVLVACARNNLQDPDGIPRTIKAENIAAGGADAFILYNQHSGDNLPAEEYALPSAHFTYEQWFGGLEAATGLPQQGIQTWLNSAGEKGQQLSIGITQVERKTDPQSGDWLAPFSSRGPSNFVPEVLIPAVAAPGVNVYAAYSDEQPFTEFAATSDFAAISGTSMASPNAAGSLALIRQAHPDWSATQVQSALMLTADNLVKFNRNNVLGGEHGTASIYRAGAGRINVAKAINAGLVMDETMPNFRAANPENGGQPRRLNIPQLVNMHCKPKCQWSRTFTATRDGSWALSHSDILNWHQGLYQQYRQNGIQLKITPSEFSLKQGESQTIIVETEIMDTQDIFSNSEVELHTHLLLEEVNEQSPQMSMPVVFKYDNNDMPGRLEAELHGDQGQHLFKGLPFGADEQVFTRVYAATKAEVQNIRLPKDDDNDFPWSPTGDPVAPAQMLDEATHVINIEVPKQTKTLIIESLGTLSSELQGKSFDTGNLVIYVGHDYNQNGQPDPMTELLCTSHHVMLNNYCHINNPVPGNYWAILYNPGRNFGTGENLEPKYPDLAPEQFSYTVALVADSTASQLSASTLKQENSKVAALQLNWDMVNMQEGDLYYSMVDFGSSEVNAGNKGKIPLKLSRGANNVSITSARTQAAVGDSIPFTLAIRPNLSGQQRQFAISMALPQGASIKASDVLVDSAMVKTVDVKANQILITGVQPDTSAMKPGYKITTNQDDSMCRTPDFGLGSDGGYVDLEQARIYPQLSGFNLSRDSEGNTIGDNDITWAEGIKMPVSSLFNGLYDRFHLYNNSDELNYARVNQLYIRGNGNIGFSELPFFFPFHSGFPYNSFPYESVGVLWRGVDGLFGDYKMLSVPLDLENEIAGISLASTATGWGIIEYDNARSYLQEGFDDNGLYQWQAMDDRFDFELIFNVNVRHGDNQHELYMAYDNINFGAENGRGSVGLQGFKGLISDFGPLQGILGEQYSMDDLDKKLADGLVICYDYQGPESSYLEVNLSAAIQPDAVGQELEFVINSQVSGMADSSDSHTIKVPGHISLVPLKDLQVAENASLTFKVLYVDHAEFASKNTISVSGQHIAAQVKGHEPGAEVVLTPQANFHGSTQVEVTVSDIEHPKDSATQSFTLSVISDGVELGCTNKEATNYDPAANKDNGSCRFPQHGGGGGSLGLLWLLLCLPLLRTRLTRH